MDIATLENNGRPRGRPLFFYVGVIFFFRLNFIIKKSVGEHLGAVKAIFSPALTFFPRKGRKDPFLRVSLTYV